MGGWVVTIGCDSNGLSRPSWMNSLMWTATTRAQHKRDGLRFASDMTDAEWALIEPLPTLSGGHRRMADAGDRQCDVLRGGIPWRMLPECFPPCRPHGRFAAWRDGGVWQTMRSTGDADRERVGREASPSAAVIDSQSVKTTEAGGPRGYDAGKKVLGRKRHAMVDTDGRPLVCRSILPRVQDRDGAVPLLKASRRELSVCRARLRRHRLRRASVSPTPPSSPSRSSANRPIRSVSRCIRAAGWSNAASRGSVATAGWLRTSRPPSPQPPPSLRRVSHAADQAPRSLRVSSKSDSKRSQ